MFQPSRFVSVAAIVITTAMASPSMAQLQFQDQTNTRFPQPNLNEYTNQASMIDLDNDNDLDIVFANGQGFSAQGAALRPRVFINNGVGVFTDNTTAAIGLITGWFRGVEFGDCDRDGDWDMILVQDFNKQPQLFINNGLGIFSNQTATRLPAQTLSSSRAQFGDIDNDGDLDLVLCNAGTVNRFGSGQPKMYMNDGTGVYTDGTVGHLPILNVTDQQDVIFGDIDGDLDLDIHLGSRAGQSKLWVNNGSGTYASLPGFPGGGNAYSYDFGDLEGDGDLDLLGVNGGTELMLRNNNPGSTTWTNVSAEISPNSAIDDNDSKFFDYDNDGDLDFIVGSLGATERIFRNNGLLPTADFTQVTGVITSVGDASLDIKVGDLTGDGKLDVVTLQGESGSFIDRMFVNIGPAGVVDNRSPKIIKTETVPSTDTTNPGPFTIRTVIYDDYTSDRGFYAKNVTLNYSVDGGAVQQEPMVWSGNSMWRGVLPAQKGGGLIEYFVTATDFNNNVGTGPTQSFTIIVPTPCIADIDGSAEVDVDDLLTVIGEWGATVSTADIAPPGGDSMVDVDDLLAVIGAWGPCP